MADSTSTPPGFKRVKVPGAGWSGIAPAEEKQPAKAQPAITDATVLGAEKQDREQERKLPAAFQAAMWQPGQSGNPAGRPKGDSWRTEMRRRMEADPQKYADWIENRIFVLQDREAFEYAVDQVYGKARQTMDVNSDSEGPNLLLEIWQALQRAVALSPGEGAQQAQQGIAVSSAIDAEYRALVPSGDATEASGLRAEAWAVRPKSNRGRKLGSLDKTARKPRA